VDAQGQRDAFISQISAAQAIVGQKIRDRDQDSEIYQKLASTLNSQPGQNCTAVTTTSQDGISSQQQSCRANPALKPLQNEVAATKAKLSDAETAIKQEQAVLAKLDRRPFDERVSKAEAEYRSSVYQSQLHSYTAMLFRKDAQQVTDGEIKTLEGYLIWIPSIAAALSSTLIAMTAVHRIKAPKTEPETLIPDEAAAYLFGPLIQALRKEANDAVAAALNGHAKAQPNTS
jgi:hypothetical protein